jgi:aminoglycoside phosphotransferase (APT) family kinase protein
VGEEHALAWLAGPSVDAVRDALRQVMPGLSLDEVTLNDVLEASNPRWQRGTAWIGAERIAKFAWSPEGAAGLDFERRVVLALVGTPFQRWLPPIELTSERPLLLITFRVDGEPCVDAVFGNDAAVTTEATDVARALTDLHDPAVLAAVRPAVPDLPPPVPQAETDVIRARIPMCLGSARAGHVDRWCDWVDDVQTRAAGDTVLLHGDLHGYNMLVEEGQLRGVLDYEGVSVGDHHYDFRYLPGLERSIRFFVLVAEAYERFSGRTVQPAPVLAWHIRTVLGDALWRSEAGIPLPDGGTVDQWVDELRARITALAAWRPFDVP